MDGFVDSAAIAAEVQEFANQEAEIQQVATAKMEDALQRLLGLLDARKAQVMKADCGKYTIQRTSSNTSVIYLALESR